MLEYHERRLQLCMPNMNFIAIPVITLHYGLTDNHWDQLASIRNLLNTESCRSRTLA